MFIIVQKCITTQTYMASPSSKCLTHWTPKFSLPFPLAFHPIFIVDVHRLKIQGKDPGCFRIFPEEGPTVRALKERGVPYFSVLCFFIDKFFENFFERVLFYLFTFIKEFYFYLRYFFFSSFID